VQSLVSIKLTTSSVLGCNGTTADATAAISTTLDMPLATGGDIRVNPATSLPPPPMASAFNGTATSTAAVDATGNGPTTTPTVSTPMVSHFKLAFIQVCKM
jgi:hypothetical protein